MNITKCRLLKASTIAIALLGSTAIVTTVTAPDFAYAKQGNGNGGGNGNGNGGGNGNGNGGGNSNGAKGNGGDHGAAAKGGGGSKVGKSGSQKTKSRSAGAGQKKGGGFSLKDLFSGNSKARKTGSPRTTAVTTQGAQKPTHQTAIVEESKRPVSRAKGNRMAALLGAHPSELGALNAANASPTALANASPNSRVGRIATYRDTVLAGEPLREDLVEQLEVLAGLEQPDRTVQEIEDDLEAALGEVQTNRDTVDELAQALEDAGGTDPDIEAQLEDAQAALGASIDDARSLSDERQAAIDYNEAVEEAEELNELVEAQDLAEREALEAAANKPVTDAVEAQVKSLLGL
ncbi:hypothetical protein [uncultured Ruegeria sp.]|uniref:hypothetical protein n=2 Tax=uncultured Ruegeria sp. TaxID=259304 RepID=UPI00261CD38F|nr:hypothetical protein [uncultured Ruegeria sp.]